VAEPLRKPNKCQSRQAVTREKKRGEMGKPTTEVLALVIAELEIAATLCVTEALRKPDNAKATDPRATYKSAALRCAYVIRQRIARITADDGMLREAVSTFDEPAKRALSRQTLILLEDLNDLMETLRNARGPEYTREEIRDQARGALQRLERRGIGELTPATDDEAYVKTRTEDQDGSGKFMMPWQNISDLAKDAMRKAVTAADESGPLREAVNRVLHVWRTGNYRDLEETLADMATRVKP
jgi:hypothetical protein